MSEASKVVSLRGDALPSNEPVPAVIAEAERILEMARSGEIVGLAAAYSHKDECTSSHFVGDFGRQMLGQIDLLHAEMVHTIMVRDGRI